MFSLVKSLSEYVWPAEAPKAEEKASDHFYYHQYGNKHLVRVTDTDATIELYSISEDEIVETIAITNIVGCRRGTNEFSDRLLYTLYTCEILEGHDSRVYREIVLESTGSGIPDWYQTIASRFPKRMALIVINPIGGSRNAQMEYESTVQPMLMNANYHCTPYITNKKDDARGYVRNVSLTGYDRIVVMGGDGTVSEVINGLLERTNSSKAKHPPLGVIPVGSGNGLSRSLLHEVGETFSLITSVYRVIAGERVDVPLILNRVIGKKTIELYSFLANAWGLPSDVDIESEMFRFLGSFRFTIGTVVRLINLRVYHGLVHYLPLENSLSLVHYRESGEKDSKWETISNEEGFVLVWACNAPYVAEDVLAAPTMQLKDPRISLIVIKYPISRYELITMFINLEKGDHVNSECVDSYQVQAFEIEPVAKESGTLTIDGELINYGRLGSCVSSHSFGVMR